jgi:hypothetical protein
MVRQHCHGIGSEDGTGVNHSRKSGNGNKKDTAKQNGVFQKSSVTNGRFREELDYLDYFKLNLIGASI